MTFLLPAHKHTEYYYVSWRYMSLCISDAKLKEKLLKSKRVICVYTWSTMSTTAWNKFNDPPYKTYIGVSHSISKPTI